MPAGSVTVTFPKNRLVFINGDYQPEFPKKIQCTFLVEFGRNIFETLNGDNQVDYRAAVVVNASNPNCEIELVSVQPAALSTGKKSKKKKSR